MVKRQESFELAEDVVVLIPAYKPDEKMIALVEGLRSRYYPVIVVDDGSGASFYKIFAQAEELGAIVVSHAANLGKGRALKTGLNHIALMHSNIIGAVTADADGQHSIEDIERVIKCMRDHRDEFVIGVRVFGKNVPLRSKMGNNATRIIFRLATGIDLSDTQTGLRGLPACYFEDLIALRGERYDFEMNMLLQIKNWRAKYVELPIKTIYFNDNKASHFRTFSDAFLVFKQILTFGVSGLISFAIDYGLYLIALSRGTPVEVAYVAARIVSATVNFLINKNVVFGTKSTKKSAIGYIILALAIMVIGALSTKALNLLGVNGIIGKPIVDIVLFFLSYMMQREVIFKRLQDKE